MTPAVHRSGTIFGIPASAGGVALALLYAGRRRIEDPGDVHAAFDFELAVQASFHIGYSVGALYQQVVQHVVDAPAGDGDRSLRWRLIAYAVEFLLAKDGK